MSLVKAADPAEVEHLLAPLCEDPRRAGIFCDIDGTLAPIRSRADEVVVPARTRDLLIRLSRRYAMVGCVSGRRAAEARRLVGIGSITYIGNHGFERLGSGERSASLSAALTGHEAAAKEFVKRWDDHDLRRLQLRIEDKAAIFALHWRGAPDEKAAEGRAREIAAAAEEEGLVTHWGRKVLEIRPPVEIDKGAALVELIAEAALDSALYAGDDRTDVDAFRSLRQLRDTGGLETAVCVGVASAEGPAELVAEADIVVAGPAELADVLDTLAG